MTAYASEADDHVSSRTHSGSRYRTAKGAAGGYRIDVVARTVEDLVQSAGGWLYDRISTGWTVNVLMNEHDDIRPLQILGVPTVSANVTDGSTKGLVYTLALAADLLASDARVRENVVSALDRDNAVITLWGDVLPDVLVSHVKVEQHRLSNAARLFKAQALRAASLPHERVGPTETLHRCAGAILLRASGISAVGRTLTACSD